MINSWWHFIAKPIIVTNWEDWVGFFSATFNMWIDGKVNLTYNLSCELIWQENLHFPMDHLCSTQLYLSAKSDFLIMFFGVVARKEKGEEINADFLAYSGHFW